MIKKEKSEITKQDKFNSICNEQKEKNVFENIELRKANDGDTEFMCQTHHRAYHEVVTWQFGSFDEAMQDDFFFQELKEHDGFQIIQYNKEPCGYALFEEEPDCIKAWELVILPEFQNLGIGSAMLNKIMNIAKEKNLPVKLSVLKENKAAELYAKLGFVKAGETETHYEMEWKSDEK